MTVGVVVVEMVVRTSLCKGMSISSASIAGARPTHLGPANDRTPIHTPRQRKNIPQSLQLRRTRSRPYIPEPHRPITRATRQLKLPDRIEQNLLHPMRMPLQFNLTFRIRSIRVPDPDTLV